MKSFRELYDLIKSHIKEIPYEGAFIDYNAIVEDTVQIQKNAYNEALDDAAHAVRLSLNGSNTPYIEHSCKEGRTWTVNENSILKLKK